MPRLPFWLEVVTEKEVVAVVVPWGLSILAMRGGKSVVGQSGQDGSWHVGKKLPARSVKAHDVRTFGL